LVVVVEEKYIKLAHLKQEDKPRENPLVRDQPIILSNELLTLDIEDSEWGDPMAPQEEERCKSKK
jgi:hypothetical protein